MNAGKEGEDAAASRHRQSMTAAEGARCADTSTQCDAQVDVKSVQCGFDTKRSVCTQTSAWTKKMKGSAIARREHGTPPEQDPPCQRRPVSHCMEDVLTSMSSQLGEATEKMYECNHCKKRFVRRDRLVQHLRMHTGERPYQCDHCKSGFTAKGALMKHLRTHSDERPYRCDYCESSFKFKDKLASHVRIHTGERPYRCDHCERSFARRCHLTIHVRTHMPNDGDDPTGKLHECSYCKRKLQDRSTLVRHLRVHTGEHPYHCDSCKCSFKYKCNLLKHIRTRTCKKIKPTKKLHVCSYCKIIPVSRSTLVMHLRIHTGERPYRCVRCKRNFKTNSSLLGHHMRTHTGEPHVHGKGT